MDKLENVKQAIESLRDAYKTEDATEYDMGILYGLEIALNEFND